MPARPQQPVGRKKRRIKRRGLLRPHRPNAWIRAHSLLILLSPFVPFGQLRWFRPRCFTAETRRSQSHRPGPAPQNSAAPAISAVNPVPFLNTGATAAAGWPKETQNQKKRTAATASSQRPQPHPFGFPFFRRLSFLSASSPDFGPAISPQRRGERRASVAVRLRGILRPLRSLR